MRLVGASEARNKLDQLLDLVEQGEEITITRHGKEVARLVPAHSIRSREAAPGRRSAHPGARRTMQARSFRMVRMEILSGRRPPVSLVLDSLATLA